MRTNYNCIPCFTRQALDAVRFATDDKITHEIVLRKALKSMSNMDMNRTPPEMGAHIHRLVKEHSGNKDPYLNVKKEFNQIALDLYPELLSLLKKSDDRFDMAVRLAIAGNIIDFGVNANVNKKLILKTIEQTLSEWVMGNVQHFQNAVSKAKTILYIGDNSGEIVFDRLFIEQLLVMGKTTDQITFAVRGVPIINDITMIDAVETGMTETVSVIDNGYDVPGTVLSKCSKQFQESFNNADLVISKGQGNYETLSDVDKNIFFLLKAKCEVIATNIGCSLGTSIIKESVSQQKDTKE